MEIDNNIKSFTGADIEKYHKGLLSAKERNNLEKAALDDPFLAEALEGYAIVRVDHAADMEELKKRLAEKVEMERIIPLNSGGRRSFPWLRAAALVIVIAGAALLANQFIFKGNDNNNIAQADRQKREEIRPSGGSPGNNISSGTDSAIPKTGMISVPQNQDNRSFTVTPDQNATAARDDKESAGKGKVTTPEVTVMNDATVPANPAPVTTEDETSKSQKITAVGAEKKILASEEAGNKPGIGKQEEIKNRADKDLASGQNEVQQNNRAMLPSRKIVEQRELRNPVNIFRGRVTDPNNVGLPFARVTNALDNNAGTYTDAKGYFNLTYPDSVLTVEVKSIGFENTNVQLRKTVPVNQVMLQDDRTSLSELVINDKKPNSAVRRESNMKLEEPEPADGWDNYDAYLANNLNPPEEIKTKPNGGGDVQVSFEVDRNGEPTSIKIEKSLCDKCDKEAIRLIKEGPKWKRHAKNGRTTVTISFDHPL